LCGVAGFLRVIAAPLHLCHFTSEIFIAVVKHKVVHLFRRALDNGVGEGIELVIVVIGHDVVVGT
jgi:hypothetical protein